MGHGAASSRRADDRCRHLRLRPRDGALVPPLSQGVSPTPTQLNVITQGYIL